MCQLPSHQDPQGRHWAGTQIRASLCSHGREVSSPSGWANTEKRRNAVERVRGFRAPSPSWDVSISAPPSPTPPRGSATCVEEKTEIRSLEPEAMETPRTQQDRGTQELTEAARHPEGLHRFKPDREGEQTRAIYSSCLLAKGTSVSAGGLSLDLLTTLRSRPLPGSS